jgi:hypothetical protein
MAHTPLIRPDGYNILMPILGAWVGAMQGCEIWTVHVFFSKRSTDVDAHKRVYTYPYKYTHAILPYGRL